jgi:hypothetical protein
MSVGPVDAWVFGKPYRGREHRRRSAVVAAATAFFVVTGSAMALASVSTDRSDYAPGSIVTISGDNSNDAGYLAGEVVAVDVQGPNGYASSCEGVADDAGAWSCGVTLWDSELAVGSYTYQATGSISGASESGTFTDASPPKVNFAVSGLPVAATFSIAWNGTNNGGNPVSGTIAFTSPGPSSETGGLEPGSAFHYSGFPASLTNGGQSCSRTGTAPADGFTTPSTGTTTVTATYSCSPSDSSPPVISKVVTGTLGSNGWYTSNVQVAWTVMDAESVVVIDSGCGTQSFTSETAGTTSSCAAHSTGGSSSDSVNLKIDKTGPSASLAITSGTLGSHGWYVSDVTVSTTGSDAVSDNVVCTGDQHLNVDSAGTTFNGTCTNGAGLSTNAAPLVVKRDTTAPTITPTLSPAANSDGWNSQASVIVSYACSDATSHLDPAYGNDGSGCWSSDTATLQGLTTFVNRTVFDLAGNSASVSPDVRIDRDPPTIVQGATTGTVGSNGWYTSDVSVDFTASDGLSGLKHPLDASFTLSASGEGPAVATGTKTVSDKADNAATAGPLTFMIDTSDPLVSCDPLPSGWSGTDITVDCTAGDGVSGLANPADASFSLTTNVPSGTEDPSASTDSRNVCDNAGRCVTAGPFTGLMVDKKAPDVSCANPDGLWHNADVTLGCLASDGGSGLNVPADASFGLSTNVTAGTETSNASTGSHQVCDAVNNCATAGPIAGNMVDEKAPDVSCANPDGLWHNADVTLGCLASDGGSGPLLDFASLSTNVPVGSEDGNAATTSHSFCDAVNNCSTAGPIAGNKIDKKGPTVTITTPAEGSSFVLGQIVSSSYGCSDGGSGLATCSGPASVDTSSVGSKTFTASGSDVVGNIGSDTNAYSVAYAIGGSCLGSPGHQVLQPINADGSSAFKKGSTVPVKFRVCDANGNSIGTAGVVSTFKLVKTVAGTFENTVDESPISTTPDTAFRWDPTDRQWIHNLNTKNLAGGITYFYRITLNDTQTIEFHFYLRT